MGSLIYFYENENANTYINRKIKKNVKVERSDGSSCSVDNVAIKTESDLGGLTNQDDEDDSDCVPDSDQVSYQNVYIDYDDLQTIGEGEDCELLESDRDEDIEIEADTITDEDSVSNLLKDHLSIVFDSQLLVLSKLKIPAKCRKCDGVITEELKHVGSSTLIIWMCTSGHKIERWCSQPVVRRIRVGDFLLASNILASGNNYRKIAMLFQFMNMGCVSESTFNRIQKHYCSPAITNFR
ncbi:hypothetical protein LOTGIDRAFT_176233 [Lottia gigantea]|uniref:Uncharacterized protein n=1 Tax=Lottia gigantea TaxID=225164 RepID=V3YZ93_LOTGI|nr:hypothetical protein LOTGIDRAFT_176233 [Lottia gigantea]ESO83478.1 hypothetical protein LOTGIDRAFT_176233 [Lottia gigantea]